MTKQLYVIAAVCLWLLSAYMSQYIKTCLSYAKEFFAITHCTKVQQGSPCDRGISVLLPLAYQKAGLYILLHTYTLKIGKH